MTRHWGIGVHEDGTRKALLIEDAGNGTHLDPAPAQQTTRWGTFPSRATPIGVSGQVIVRSTWLDSDTGSSLSTHLSKSMAENTTPESHRHSARITP